MLEDEREIQFPVQKNNILKNASVEEISNVFLFFLWYRFKRA